ncbi:MAG TPA: NAD-dependent epimerase/dehydratase family protein [Steroidobacteraceae bacterium]|nr:NAD-dependent epimerase/dehydratase family protein [Steroidobacteraceae bacterium]
MRVLVIGSEGFVGKSLMRRLRAGAAIGTLGRSATLISRLDLHMESAGAATPGPTERCIAGDLGERAVLEAAIAGGVDCIFHLASVPGGAAERDFELGLKVNLQSMIALLEVLRSAGNRPRMVFASTVGVYGVPMPEVIDEDTLPIPSLSYGAHKFVGEVLLADYSRRRFIDGRALRMPGIVARPPTRGMLSIFLSDLIRDLSAGREVVCPVAADAPSWWMSRPCVVDNLLHAASIPDSALPAQRSYLLPVQRLTMAEVVSAVADRCGAEVLGRVSYRPDPLLQLQFASYPPLHSPHAHAAGFRHDGDAATLVRRALEDD